MKIEYITLAGGCFWCMESPYSKIPGIIEVIPGYTGGITDDPTYNEICTGLTGHYEAVKIKYNIEEITLKEILSIYWKQIDPTDKDGQFADRGSQYRTAIFYNNEEQKKTAMESKSNIESKKIFNDSIMTEILPAVKFHQAEEYHEKYFLKEPERYLSYRIGSGREGFLQKYWK